MKKIYTLLFAASALFAATSCQEEIVDPTLEDSSVKEAMTITATVGAETKTVLGNNGVSTFWTDKDQISVFDSNKEGNNRKFSVVTEEVEFPAKQATFALDAAEEFVWPQNDQPDPLIVALYPYQENAYCDFFYYDRNYITGLVIPVEQKAVKNAFDPTATFALATGKYSTKDELQFTNLYSLLRITLKEEGVTKVKVTMTGNNIAIAGEAKVQLDLKVDGEVPYFNGGVLTASGSNSVTLECEGGFEVGEKYYIAVAPVTYTNIKVELLKGETWTVVKNTTPENPKKLEANHIYNISNLDDPKTVADGVYLNEEGVYEISNEAGLFWLADQVNNGTEYFAGEIVKLMADIDLAGAEWTPIGSAYKDHGFMGNFDGNGKTIKNLKISALQADSDGYVYAGLFGVTEGTIKDNQNYIKNLTIENVAISTEGHIVAAAIAYPYYTVVENITVKGDINIKGGDYTAGVLSYTRRCVDVSNISIEGNTGSSIEGGQTVGGVISDIQMNGGLTANYSNFKASGLTITAEMHVGGISGIISKQRLNGATVKNVTIVCDDVRKGTVSGSLGDPSTITNVSVENVTGATNVVGGTFKEGSAVVGDENGVYTVKVWAERNLAFAEESGTATYGEDFKLPELTGEGDLTKAVYSVAEGEAATVTEAGVVTLVKAGTVTIKATVGEDNTHKEGEAFYTLTVVEDWGVCGTFVGWDVKNSMSLTYAGDGWYEVSDVELYKDDEFKFVLNKSWDDKDFGAKDDVLIAEINHEYELTESGKNIKVSKNGKFTLNLNPTTKKFKVECDEEYTNLKIQIKVENKANWTPLYIHLTDEKGNKIADGAQVSGNVYEVSGDYIGSSLTYYFTSDTKESEPAKVTITKAGATVVLEENIVKFIFQLNTANSKQWWGDTAKIYVWDTGTSFDTAWPGHTMTSEGNHTWSIIVPSELIGKTINYIVNNGDGWQSNDSKVTIKAEGNTVTGSSIGIN